VNAIVLAGGEGTRLRPLTWTTPKPLLPIVNRPFLEHQLAWLAGHGVTEVVLSLGYRSDAFAGRSFSDLPLQVATEPGDRRTTARRTRRTCSPATARPRSRRGRPASSTGVRGRAG